jgi:hypothetical protein
MRITPDNIEHEERLVWECDPSGFEYVRQRLEICGTRVKGVPFNGRGERIGYAILAPYAPRIRKGTWERRVFYVRPNDRSEHPRSAGPYDWTAPHEAVDPRTLSAGVVGEITSRAWGAPVS